MKFRKYFVRVLDTDETMVVSSFKLLDVITDAKYCPVRVTPLDRDGNLMHEYAFLVGDEYSLSFLFNDKNI